jgi:hypothetical protein
MVHPSFLTSLLPLLPPEMTNDYYELIPHANFSRTAVAPLDSEDAIRKEITMITGLKEISIARKILLAAT